MRSMLASVLTIIASVATASAQSPPCPECVPIAPTFNPVTQTSYVLIASACDNNNPLAVAGWTRAQNLAVSRFGTNLATIESADENDWLRANLVLPSGSVEVWIGLWFGNNTLAPCANRYVWASSSPSTYRNFSPGEPNCTEGCNGFGSVGYVLMNLASGLWNDTKNGAQCCYSVPFHGLVEIPCPDRIELQPVRRCARPGQNVELSVSVANDTVPYARKLRYQWRRNGVPLANGPTGSGSSIAGAFVSNSSSLTSTLTISSVSALDQGNYDVVISTTCRSAIQSVSVRVGVCVADFNCSENTDLQDVFDFLNAWFSEDLAADINGAGLAIQDIFDFLNIWFVGC